jgi:hypothetical protein
MENQRMPARATGGEPNLGVSDQAVWLRCQTVEASEDEAERFLDLAGLADERLDEDEAERVAAQLDAAGSADLAAASTLATANDLPAAPAAVVSRAMALVGAEVVPFRPRHPVAAIWQGMARWGSLAAAIAVASWLGFDLGSAATTAYTQPAGSDAGSLADLLDPGAIPVHDLAENSRS